jgi:4-amino-4-deoxy-L-arabinose transferase-like glycosyltransferase
MSHIINHRLNQFSWAVAAILFLPLLFTQGMFFNGLTYAAIARNLNEGLGTFWAPHYCNGIHNVFYEHPPFSFAIHSVFYRLFGDQPWVDRFYAYTLYGLSILMLRRIWALFIPAGHRGWIPQLLWTLTPTVIWVHQNNMLEAPLAAASLSVIWLLIEGAMKRNYLWSAIAGVLFFISLGIKGPVALFPLVTLPFLATIFPEYRKSAIISVLFLIVVFSTLFSYFYVFVPEFAKFFEHYLNIQLFPSILGERPPRGSFLQSIIELGKQVMLPAVVLIIMRVKGKKSFKLSKPALFFFLIALSATVPFFFFNRQDHYYFMPSMAYWMLAMASIMEQQEWPWGIQRKKWVKRLMLTNFGLWFIAIVLSIYWSKSPSRDKHEIKAFRAIAEAYDGQPIQVMADENKWKWVAIAERYHHMELVEHNEDLVLLNAKAQPLAGYAKDMVFEKADMILYKKATP